jgi:hypothetical protein
MGDEKQYYVNLHWTNNMGRMEVTGQIHNSHVNPTMVNPFVVTGPSCATAELATQAVIEKFEQRLTEELEKADEKSK